MRPACSKTLRCFEIAGWEISNGSASSFTVAWPDAKRANIARRVGSASAAKVASRWLVFCITIKLYNQVVIYIASRAFVNSQCRLRSGGYFYSLAGPGTQQNRFKRNQNVNGFLVGDTVPRGRAMLDEIGKGLG